jgi:hypothetical protein
MARAQGKTRKPSAPAARVCDACGALNESTASECAQCGSKRFAPIWIRHLRRVTKNFAVQVADAHPLAASTDQRLVLYKWWPGGRSTFNINTSSQWEAVKAIIDTDLAQYLGWRTVEAIKQDITVRQGRAAALDRQVRELGSEDPRLLTEILRGLKLDKISEEDLPKLGETIGDILAILYGVDESYRHAIQQLIRKLPTQGELAIRQFSQLMEELTIGQITAIAGEVKRRLGFLSLFKERVLDDKTYEIRGDGSIHRLLETAMWIVDERYWLMHSNAQLRTVISKQIQKEDKKRQLERPDFVCGSVEGKLIVIEIKRPSHKLTVEDLNQLERYVVLCKKYEQFSSFEALLVGHQQTEDLRHTMEVRRQTFGVRTYTQLVSDAERRYRKYLDAIRGG